MEISLNKPMLRLARPAVSLRLALAAGGVALLAAIPLGYILVRAAAAEPEAWTRLLQTRLWKLLGNTLLLAGTVTAGALVLGTGLAWLTERTDLPGRKIFRWLLAMPLAIPAYIGGIIHLALVRPRGGLVPQAAADLLGRPIEMPNLLGFWGAVFVLTLFSFPYVYLLSGAAFRSLSASVGEAARTLGCSPWQTFWQVTLPALRPGLTAGALLVMLDILAEYGTVALLRYETFSSAIFIQLSGRYDRSAASVLSGVLVILAVLILAGELKLQGQARFTQVQSGWRPAPPVMLNRMRLPAMGITLGVVCASLMTPVALLLAWSMQALTEPQALQSSSQGFAHFAWNSLWTSTLAAGLAVMLSLPVALLTIRHPGRWTRSMAAICQVGYAIPGVVIALSLAPLVNGTLPFLYGTSWMVVLAYLLRHMPQALRASASALGQISLSLEEAARTLGRSSIQAMVQVTLPLVMPGLLAGGALVLLTSLKELPATLLLRPAGFDTLAVRAWTWAADGFYVQAAPAALFLVLASVGPLFFLLRQERLLR